MLASHDPKFRIWPWSNTVPYVVFNLRSPDASGAMGNLKVRQAIEFGINKATVQKVVRRADGGPGHQHGHPAGQRRLLRTTTRTPTNNGTGRHRQVQVDARAAPATRTGVTLTNLYVNDSVNTRYLRGDPGQPASLRRST